MNGRSQAIRLPAEFRFSGREVFIEKQGDAVIIRPKPAGWDDFFCTSAKGATRFSGRAHGYAARGKGTVLMRYMLDTNICSYYPQESSPLGQGAF